MNMRRVKRPFLAAIVTIALLPVAADTEPSRYNSLFRSDASKDTLLNLALWEDQRVTDDGRLFGYLKSDNPLVRLRTVEVIGRLQTEEDVDRLTPLLLDPDIRVVNATVFALGQIGSATALPALSKFANDARSTQLEFAAEAFGKIGTDEAVAELIELLRNFNTPVRAEAALGLARAEAVSGVNALMISSHDPAPEVMWRVIYALEKIDHNRVGPQVVGFIEHANPKVRAYAARTVGRQEFHGAVAPLIRALADEDLRVVVNAADALGRIGDVEAVRPLGLALKTHPSFHGRAAAARGLAGIEDKSGKDYLIQAMLDPSPSVRAEVVNALAKTLGKGAALFCDQLKNDGSRHVRAAAITALGTAEAKGRIDDLMRIANKDKDTLMRAAALSALAKMDDDRIGPFLVARLKDEDWVVAATAAAAIGEAEYSEAVPALIETFRGRQGRQEGNIRMEVLRALEELDASQAVSLLIEVLEDDDYRARALAAEILSGLDGVTFPALKSDRWFHNASFDRSRRLKLAPPTGTHHAIIKTKHGDIAIELFGDDAPQTVAIFTQLAQAGFYNGLNFHRVVPNFVIQGGDPRGDGWGDAGYYIRSEFNMHRYGEGYVGIAHDGKDTGGTQFFITHSDQHHLDGKYTIFGKVTSGMDVVWKIDVGDKFEVTIVD